MRTFFLLAAALLLAFPARAALVTFAARATFGAAAGRLAVEDFTHCAHRTLSFTGPLDAASANAACAAGAVRPGLTLADDGGPGRQTLFLAAPGYAGNREFAVGQNDPASDGLSLSFTGGTGAAGFDLFQNFGGGAQLGRAADYPIRVYSGVALLGAFDVSVPSGRGAFFGVVSTWQPITRVAVNNPRAYDMVGGIAYAAPGLAVPLAIGTRTPEPAPLALLGLSALALARRRR